MPVRTRLVPLLVGLVGVLLVPWAAVLDLYLPSRHETVHWDLAWSGFDVGLAAALLAVAFAAWRQRRWLPAAAGLAAGLLACDAWFDLLTAHTRTELAAAAVLAAVAELPMCALCLRLAFANVH